jgi:hypothetical protein
VSTGRSIHAASSINPVAGGGNRRLAETARSERDPIALAEGRPEDSRAKASAEIDAVAVTAEGKSGAMSLGDWDDLSVTEITDKVAGV